MPKSMQAIKFDQPGNPEVLYQGSVPMPELTPDALLVKVQATALNRADTLQRRGLYPAPPGDSNILGLEIAGEVVALGKKVENFTVGDRVFGLVGGGGYAEYCLLDSQMAMPMPDHWDYSYAAAIPEIFLTANETIFELGKLQTNEQLLLHAAASGVGTAAIQMAKLIGAKVYATVGSEEKCHKVLALGATAALNYKTQDFLPWILELTAEQGVDVVEDFIGKDNFQRNLLALKTGGRLIQVATMSGPEVALDLRALMRKRLQIIGSVMRSQSLANKREINQRFRQRWWQALMDETIKPIIDKVYPWNEVIAAHQRMEQNLNVGKIILTTN